MSNDSTAETLEKLLEEAEFETVEAAKAEQHQKTEQEKERRAERIENPGMFTRFAAHIPGFLTDTIWSKFDLENLTDEESILVYDEALKALLSYGQLPLPAWLQKIFDYLETLLGPWAGLAVLLMVLTKQRAQERRPNAARDVTPKPEEQGSQDVEFG